MSRAKLDINGDNLYTEKVKRIQKLTQGAKAKIDSIPGVVDSVDSVSTTDALSANMGKVLQDQINKLGSQNHFLSTWDCTTGLPTTDPIDDPYDYRVGDYYIVSTVGDINYKPFGSIYNVGMASTTVEVAQVNINDWYLYDGQSWILQSQSQITINMDTSLSTTSTNAVENRAITNAINSKQNVISDLTTIRNNAALGATALQPGANISELNNNIGLQTAGDVAVAIAGKAEASDLEALGGRVTIAEGTIASQGESIRSLVNSQSGSTTDISDLKDDIVDIKSEIGDVNTALAGKANSADLSTVATSGKASDLINDTGFITQSYIGNGLISIAQGGLNKGAFTLNQTGATSIALDNTVVISETDYMDLQVKDPNTNYMITDGSPAESSTSIKYVTDEELQTAISQLQTAISQLQTAISQSQMQIVDDEALSSSWDGVTEKAPSKNAVYDAIGDVKTLLANL